jgi:predicted DNA-binding transcriptional regulator YafY
MPRNAEVIRQWNLLRSIEAARYGLTIAQMAEEGRVTTRTIYRDVEALQEVGFPLFSEAHENGTCWKLSDAPFKHLTVLGFSLSELCALYLSRRLLETLTGVPFQTALQDAFGKFEREIPDKMRAYLDRLPSVMTARPSAGKIKRTPKHESMVEHLVDASLERRQVEMRYFSLSHDREGDYLVYPLRIVYMHGVLYLRAWVPTYGQLRTFATHRIRKLTVREERFTPSPDWSEEPFTTSLGPNDGKAVHVVLQFEPTLAPLIRERVYHKTQRVEPRPDGSLVLELDVCDDAWLRGFILQFGHRVQVTAPSALARNIATELELARQHYHPGDMQVEPLGVSTAMIDLSAQSRLPF